LKFALLIQDGLAVFGPPSSLRPENPASGGVGARGRLHASADPDIFRTLPANNLKVKIGKKTQTLMAINTWFLPILSDKILRSCI